jgi:aminopeptidase N
MVEKFRNQGMENWAAVTLNAEYLAETTEPLRMSLVAHELTHMWIGNTITISNWRQLCLQVG